MNTINLQRGRFLRLRQAALRQGGRMMAWLRLALLAAAAGFIAFKTASSPADAAVLLALFAPLLTFTR
jgi:hypothetical protein